MLLVITILMILVISSRTLLFEFVLALASELKEAGVEEDEVIESVAAVREDLSVENMEKEIGQWDRYI